MPATRKKPIPEDLEGELTEIYKMHAPRVDLVDGPASGIGFLLAKSAGDPSMFTEDDIAALAKRSEESDPMSDTTAASADTTLTKDDGDSDLQVDLSTDAIDQDVPTVDADGDAVLDPTSPAWEALDAARAAQAIELVVALQRLVRTAAEREGQEALVGDDVDDAENAWSLQGVLADLDCILGVLAPFAVSEAAEAEDRADETALEKAGRVLSSVNEGRVQSAYDLLGDVLSTIGTADLVKADDAGELDEPVEKADDADASKLVLVYGPSGSAKPPLGAVQLDSITEFAPTPEDEDGDGTVDATEAADTTDAPPTDDTPADADQPTPGEMDDDARTIPGTDTVQAPAEDDDTEDVTKGQYSPELTAALEEVVAPLRKALQQRDEEIDDLKKSVAKFGKLPDDRNSPIRNGATPVQEATRGAAEDGQSDLAKKAQEITDPAERLALLSSEIKNRFTKR